MAEEREPLELKTNRLKGRPAYLYVDYDPELDTLYLFLAAEPQPSIAYYTDEGCYMLYDPDSLEIIGLQIENWVRVFLREHADMVPWPPRTRLPWRWERKVEDEPLETYEIVRSCIPSLDSSFGLRLQPHAR